MIETSAPPHDLQIEQTVLGSLMVDKDGINDALIHLSKDSIFYHSRHRKIWRAIIALNNAGQDIDIHTVSDKLKTGVMETDLETSAFLSEITSGIGSSAHVESHSLILKELYLRRELIKLSRQNEHDAFDEAKDVFGLYDKLMGNLDDINSDVNRAQEKSFSVLLEEVSEDIKRAANEKSYVTGLKTCLGELDRVTLGWQDSDLIIIAARPAMGKTALAIDIARKQAKELEAPVGILSLEMGDRQLALRMLSAESGIDLETLRKGGLKFDQWQDYDVVKTRMQKYPVYLIDKGGLSINEICSISKKWKVKYGIKALYIDYLQLIAGKQDGNREQEISGITRRLKALAKDLHIPVIALSQLSRQCEQRTDKRPMLSDLRESGAIEQDADVVIFPYRDDYYNDNADPGVTELIIAKYRNGKVGKVTVLFDGEHQTFKNYSAQAF